MTFLRTAAAVLGLLLTFATGAEPRSQAPPKPEQHRLQEGNVRLFYYTEGPHAVDAADSNRNGISDQVEDAMTQTLAARKLFVAILGFPDPFTTERFRSASFLDVHFRAKDTLHSNGVTYDELQHYNRPGDPQGTASLCFNLATSVKAASNLTPAHEFFHVIQNSVTYFKNRWYTEGTARWSERALGLGALGTVREPFAWPLNEAQQADLFPRAYDASETFWNPLAAQLDKEGAIPATAETQALQKMRYADGSPVLKDLRFTGWQFMRDVLRELSKADDRAFAALGYDRWSEANQSSPRNNPFLLQAIAEAVKQQQPR